MKPINTEEPIHELFGLSYCSYIVLHRSILQSMPIKWQNKFVKCLQELSSAVSEIKDIPRNYTVSTRDDKGRFIKDDYRDYERGRRKIDLKL